MRSLRASNAASDSSLFFVIRVVPALIAFFVCYCFVCRKSNGVDNQEDPDGGVDPAPPPPKDQAPERTVLEIESKLIVRTVTMVNASTSSAVPAVIQPGSSSSQLHQQTNVQCNDDDAGISSSSSSWWANYMMGGQKDNLSKSESSRYRMKKSLPRHVMAFSRPMRSSKSEPNLQAVDLESGDYATVLKKDESSEKSLTCDSTDTISVCPPLHRDDHPNCSSSPPSERCSVGFFDESSCGICLLDYAIGEEVAWSPNEDCVHAYHKKCIIGWLRKKDDCPLCRHEYLLDSTNNGVAATERDDS